MLKAKFPSKSPATNNIGRAPVMGVSAARPTDNVPPAQLPTAQVTDGVTIVQKPKDTATATATVAGATPVPVYKLATEIFPGKEKMFSTNAQLCERFDMLAAAFESEAELKTGQWAGQVLAIHQRVKADPELVTALSDEALALYFKASSQLANTAAGVAISKRLAAKRQADSLASAQAAAAELATRAAMVADDLEWE